VPSQLLNNKKVVISTLEEVRIRYGERNQWHLLWTMLIDTMQVCARSMWMDGCVPVVCMCVHVKEAECTWQLSFGVSLWDIHILAFQGLVWFLTMTNSLQ
jgi:hypothetical protein